MEKIRKRQAGRVSEAAKHRRYMSSLLALLGAVGFAAALYRLVFA